jgi:hypothetical protein
MSVDIEIICLEAPSTAASCRVADLVLLHCLEGHSRLEVEPEIQEAIWVKGRDFRLMVITLPEEYNEFPGKFERNVSAGHQGPAANLTCLVVAAAMAYTFDGWLGLDNWPVKRLPTPERVLAECLRYDSAEAAWLLDKIAEVDLSA